MQSSKLTTKVVFGKHIFLQPCQFVRNEIIAYQIRSKGRFHCQLIQISPREQLHLSGGHGGNECLLGGYMAVLRVMHNSLLLEEESIKYLTI